MGCVVAVGLVALFVLPFLLIKIFGWANDYWKQRGL